MVKRIQRIRRPDTLSLYEADSEQELWSIHPADGDWGAVGKKQFLYLNHKWHLVSNQTAQEP